MQSHSRINIKILPLLCCGDLQSSFFGDALEDRIFLHSSRLEARFTGEV